MIQANALSQNQQGNAAGQPMRSAAPGGDSARGRTNSGAMNVGQMLANLNNQNFTQAQRLRRPGDINRNLQAQTTNQQSQQTDLASTEHQLAGEPERANAADLNRSLSAEPVTKARSKRRSTRTFKRREDYGEHRRFDEQGERAVHGLLSSAGAGESMQQQNDINAQMAKFAQAINYPQQQLGTLLSSLGMTPKDTSTSSQNTSQTTTPTDWAASSTAGSRTHPASTA